MPNYELFSLEGFHQWREMSFHLIFLMPMCLILRGGIYSSERVISNPKGATEYFRGANNTIHGTMTTTSGYEGMNSISGEAALLQTILRIKHCFASLSLIVLLSSSPVRQWD
jgi:hypothetical protein